MRYVSACLLLAAACAAPMPWAVAAAQEARYRAAFVTPEVVCRVAPSHFAGAAGLMEVTDDRWGTEILVEPAATDETGELWIHVGSRFTRRFGIPNGCWVPEAMMAPTEEAGHLLGIADRLLSATAWPQLDHLLAAHSLFVHPQYRERVEASAVLGQRRVELLAKALDAAQRASGSPPPVDRDPMVLAWIESLRERVRYSEDRWGRGTWTVNDGSLEEPGEPSQPRQSAPAVPRRARALAVVASDVACRPRPSRTAMAGSVLPVDFHFSSEQADTSVAGEAWTFVRPYSCWVWAGHTAPGDSDEHVLAIADRLLRSGEGWSLDNHLRVYNVLSSRNRGHREEVEASAVLGLRRLEVLRGTLRPLSPRGADALTRAWIGSLGDEVAVTSEGHAWTVSNEAYLSLYEKYRSDLFGEEIMWKYASESDDAYSCEGEFACAVQQFVNRNARYWADFPNGRYVAEALEKGRDLLAHGLETCRAARGADPDSNEARSWYMTRWERDGVEIARQLLATLEVVGEEDKAPLVTVLDELEACASLP